MANIYNEEENMKLPERLGDYINNVLKEEGLEPKKKLTFDEWLTGYMSKGPDRDWWIENGVQKHDDYEFLKQVWKAAQENV